MDYLYLSASLGAYSACINAATLALIDAGVPMKDFICSCTAGLVDDKAIIGREIYKYYRTSYDSWLQYWCFIATETVG